MGKGFMRICYLVLLVAAFFFYVLYDRPLSTVVLVFVGLMPPVLLLLLAAERLGIRVMGEEHVEDGVLKVIIFNPLPIPMGYAEGVFRYKNHYLDTFETQRLPLPIIHMGRQTVECKMDSDCCGRIACTLESIRFQDPLRLFTFRKKVGRSWNFTLMPHWKPIEIKSGIFNKEESEGEAFSKTASGEDPSEVFDLRPYRVGDRLNRVNWKQSSRMGEDGDMLVKEFSLAIERSLVVIMEFDAKVGPGYMAAVNALVERAIGVSAWLLENKISHTAAMCGREGIFWREIDSSAALEAYITELMFQKPRQTESQAGLELLETAFGNESKSVFGACYIKSGELKGEWNLKEYFQEQPQQTPTEIPGKKDVSKPDIHLYITPVSAVGRGIRG